VLRQGGQRGAATKSRFEAVLLTDIGWEIRGIDLPMP